MRSSILVVMAVACGSPAYEAPPPSVPRVAETRSQPPVAQPLPSRSEPQGTIGAFNDCSDEAANQCSANGGHCRLVANNGCAGRGAVCQSTSAETTGCVCYCAELGPGGEVYLPM